jgi:hypothetical protein
MSSEQIQENSKKLILEINPINSKNNYLVKSTISLLNLFSKIVTEHLQLSNDIFISQKIEINPQNIFKMGMLCCKLYEFLKKIYGDTYSHIVKLIENSIKIYDWKSILITINEVQSNLIQLEKKNSIS